jgi:hypothetical protein
MGFTVFDDKSRNEVRDERERKKFASRVVVVSRHKSSSPAYPLSPPHSPTSLSLSIRRISDCNRLSGSMENKLHICVLAVNLFFLLLLPHIRRFSEKVFLLSSLACSSSESDIEAGVNWLGLDQIIRSFAKIKKENGKL